MDNTIDKDEDVSNWQEESNGDIELQPTKPKFDQLDSLTSSNRSYDIATIQTEKSEREKQLDKLREEQEQFKIYMEQQKQKEQEEWDKIDLSVNPLENYKQPDINNKEHNFQNFLGNIAIYGKIWTGNPRDRISQAFTSCALIGICLHYYLVVGEWYVENYNMPFLKYFIMIPSLIIGYTVYKCYTTEPGYIPRGNLENDPTKWFQKYEQKQEELRKLKLQQQQSQDDSNQENGLLINQDEQNLANVQLDHGSNFNDNQIFLQNKKADVDIKFYQYRYCRTCKIMRPPKSSHCQRCDMCVQTFDHHCFFIGNCVGARNIKYFLIFLVTTMIFGNIVLVLSGFMGFKQLQQNNNIMEEINNHPKSKYFFLSGLFLYVWRSCFGCPRRMHHLVGNYCCFATVFLLVQVGTQISNILTGNSDGEDGEQQLQNENLEMSYFEQYKNNPLAPIIQFVMTVSALGIATPLGCSTLFNVSRGITKKEKVQLDDTTRYKYNYDLSNKQILENMIQFAKFKKPPSYMY